MSYLDRDPFGIYRDRDNNGPGPRLMGAGTLMSEDVCSRQDEVLGDIKEIMLDMQTGQIAYAVVSFGGILGMGNKLFAVPWQALQLDTANKRFILDCTRERLESAPGFDEHRWPDMADPDFGRNIHGFYRTQQNLPGHMTSTASLMGQTTNSLQSGGSDRGNIAGSHQSVGQSGTLGTGSGRSSQIGTDQDSMIDSIKRSDLKSR